MRPWQRVNAAGVRTGSKLGFTLRARIDLDQILPNGERGCSHGFVGDTSSKLRSFYADAMLYERVNHLRYSIASA